jgi:hypothetical protein
MGIQCKLTIVNKPVNIWDLKPGERFVLFDDGFNPVTERIEIYIKTNLAKCVLDSIPEKTEFSIPKLTQPYSHQVRKVIEQWELIKI